MELEEPGEHKVVEILQQPEADMECTVVWQGAAVVVAVAERASVVHVAAVAAVAVAVDAAADADADAADAATGSFVSHHSHS